MLAWQIVDSGAKPRLVGAGHQDRKPGVGREAPKLLVGGNPGPLLSSGELMAQIHQAPRTRDPSWEGLELQGATLSVRKELDSCPSSP